MRGGVDGWIQALHPAVEGAAREGVHGEFYAIALLDLCIFTFGYTHEHLHGAYLLHGEDGGAHGEHVSLVEVTGRDIAGNGAAEDGVLLHVLVIGLAHLVVEFRGLVVALGNAALLVQGLEALELRLVIAHLKLKLLHLKAVHLRKYLTLGHIVPYLNVYLAYAACALWHYVVHGIGLDGGGIHAFLRDGLGLGLSDLYVGDCGSGGHCARPLLLRLSLIACAGDRSGHRQHCE